MCFSSQSSVSRPISRASSMGSSKSPNGERSLGMEDLGCVVVGVWGVDQRRGTPGASDVSAFGCAVDEEFEGAPKVKGVGRAGRDGGLSASMA